MNFRSTFIPKNLVNPFTTHLSEFWGHVVFMIRGVPMKSILSVVLLLVSSVAMADGFRCQGSDFRVKLFNEVQPDKGTRNPAVLTVYEKGIGTLVTLRAGEIEKTLDTKSVSYSGKTNSRVDGRYVSVRLEVEKKAQSEGVFAALHLARLTLNAAGESREVFLSCERYLKHSR